MVAVCELLEFHKLLCEYTSFFPAFTKVTP